MYQDLADLKMEALDFLEGSLSAAAEVSGKLPRGGLDSSPPLDLLLEAVHLQGVYSVYSSFTKECEQDHWLYNPLLSIPSFCGGNLQSYVYRPFALKEQTQDM